MNENSAVDTRDERYREPSFRYFAFYVMKRWRLVLLAVLICAVAALLISSVQLVVKQADENFENAAFEAYNKKLSDYSDDAQALENEIAVLEHELERLQSYYQDSMLMQIDPYHIKYSTVTYYIDADDPILLNDTELSIDYTGSLLKAYMLYLSGGDLYAQLLERFPEMKEEQYLREVFTATRDDAARMITIAIVSDDDETRNRVLDIVRVGMAEVYAETSEAIGEHRLTEISSRSYVLSDTALADKQQRNYEQILAQTSQIQEKKDELDALNKEAEGLTLEPMRRTTAKQFLKTALLAALGALGVMVLLLSVYYVASNRILDADKLRYAVKLDMLGLVPNGNPKRRRLLDRAVAAVSGVKPQTAQREAILALTAQSICTTVLANGIKEGSIALAGSIAAEELEEIAFAFNKAIPGAGLLFSAVGNPMRDASSVEGIQASGVAVVVEKQNVSLCTDVVKEVARITAWGKPVLGAVLLDADAV